MECSVYSSYDVPYAAEMQKVDLLSERYVVLFHRMTPNVETDDLNIS